MTMTQHNRLSLAEIDPKHRCILNKLIALTSIEQHSPLTIFDPERQTMLRQKSRVSGTVFRQYGYAYI
jgi:hypothetical protein